MPDSSKLLILHASCVFTGAVKSFKREMRFFPMLLAPFRPMPGIRSIIRIHLERISDSCGYGVPLFRYEGQRDQLVAWAEHKGQEGLEAYQRRKNAESIDGLPGLDWPQE